MGTLLSGIATYISNSSWSGNKNICKQKVNVKITEVGTIVVNVNIWGEILIKVILVITLITIKSAIVKGVMQSNKFINKK